MSTLVEQLFQRWQRADHDVSEKRQARELAERTEEEAESAEHSAAELLYRALGDRRVLIGDLVVWVRRDNDGVDVTVYYAAVVTPGQIDAQEVQQ